MSPYLSILCMEKLSRTIDGEVAKKKWEPVKISKKGPKLSHFFFADDLTFFAIANIENCTTINTIFQYFQDCSGQKVSLNKSRVLLSMNCPPATRTLCAETSRIEEHNSLGKYLGFPMFHQKPTNRDFQFLIDNRRKKLTSWKSKTLNMAGRLVLAKFSLEGIPFHAMSYIKISTKVTKAIDKTTRDFI